MGSAEQYLHWKRTNGAVACVFARLMAASKDRYGQRLTVVTNKDAQKVAKAIDSAITTFVEDVDAAAATIIMPAITTSAQLVSVAQTLEKFPHWQVKHWPIESTPEGAVVAFGVARTIMLADGTEVPSEALVLGPHDRFPATRKAPVTALEVFVGVPSSIDPKTQRATSRANLAHVNMTPPLPQRIIDRNWAQSQKDRLSSLGGVDDPRAKAKVSFVISTELAKQMGYAP